MAALVKIINAGVSTQVYDQISSAVEPGLRASSGLQTHVAYVEGDGMVVLEVWDSAEQHRTWFSANVEPHLPPGTSVDVVELHHVVTPV